MEREHIIKALEYCSSGGSCNKCPYDDNPRLSFEGCLSSKMKDALSLIKELTEENERLRAENAEQDAAIIKALKRMGEIRRETKADTVRKMQERLRDRHLTATNPNVICLYETELDQVAKEILESAE